MKKILLLGHNGHLARNFLSCIPEGAQISCYRGRIYDDRESLARFANFIRKDYDVIINTICTKQKDGVVSDPFINLELPFIISEFKLDDTHAIHISSDAASAIERNEIEVLENHYARHKRFAEYVASVNNTSVLRTSFYALEKNGLIYHLKKAQESNTIVSAYVNAISNAVPITYMNHVLRKIINDKLFGLLSYGCIDSYSKGKLINDLCQSGFNFKVQNNFELERNFSIEPSTVFHDLTCRYADVFHFFKKSLLNDDF